MDEHKFCLKNISAEKISSFQHLAAEFFNIYGRKDLKWRKTSDPWKILLAEILLRKTTARQVIPVYTELEVLSLRELADIPEEILENILKPLGIYRERARLIKKTAQIVLEAGIDKLEDEQFLLSLPGIGPYAANAVLCFAFDKAKPALDRNMIRIIERVFSIQSSKSRPHTDKRLWYFAEKLVPDKEPKFFNWGILDLSDMLCRPRNPKCPECPLTHICDFADTLHQS
ncbi:MAG: A/G-specific adenine glycosylase [Methanobacteriota archaeon]|nr:MAG: A/G-specific adenine glycosylase [Euryarchaeota archaeon]